MTLLSFNTKTTFKFSYYRISFSLDLLTIQHQQTQDPVLKTVYHWIRKNFKPDSPTPLIHRSPSLHAFKRNFPNLYRRWYQFHLSIHKKQYHWNVKFELPLNLATDTPLELMDLLKFKIKILVHLFVCSYKTLSKIRHNKFICTLLHIIHKPFQH